MQARAVPDSDWARLHQGELRANWEHARRDEPLESIDPLP